eukprot:8610899-Pyramimonas_sp.AAC.1
MDTACDKGQTAITDDDETPKIMEESSWAATSASGSSSGSSGSGNIVNTESPSLLEPPSDALNDTPVEVEPPHKKQKKEATHSCDSENVDGADRK